MAITGGHCVGEYQGHAIALVQSNWDKSLRLFIDGREVARTSCLFPGLRTLTGELEHQGVRHAVVARSIPRRLVFTRETITVDGRELPLRYEKPRGLIRAVFKAVWAGEPLGLIMAGALALLPIAILAAVVATALARWGR
jgi:hypothetical protein